MRFDAVDDSTGLQLVNELHGKAALGSRESTRPTSDDVDFGDFQRPAISIRQFRLTEHCRINDVFSIGRGPLSRPMGSKVREIANHVPGQ